MKKNRLILMLNVSVVALTPSLKAQDVADAMQNADDAVKQQLEQFADDKSSFDTNSEAQANPDTQSEKSEDQSSSQAATDADNSEKKTDSSQDSSENALDNTQESEVSTDSQVPKSQENEAAQDSSQSDSSLESTEQPQEQKEDTQSIEIPMPATPEPYGPTDASVKTVDSVTETPSVPEPTPAPVPEPAPESQKEEVKLEPVLEQKPQPVESLLDTIDIEEGGNWVLKRKALQDTVRKVEDINSLYDDIRDTNVVFLQGINTVDVLFAQFTYDVGLDLGKVDQLVQDVAHHLESERAQDGDLSEAERELLNKAEARKKDIEQLRSNIQDIWQANAQLKEARSLNDEQIIEADRLRKQAWANFRMIERVLNEVKAEQLYYETVQLFEALQTSHRYLQTRLIPHFEQSIKTIQAKMQSVKEQSENLQKEGVLLKQEAVHLDRTQKGQTPEEVEVPQVQSTGWLTTLKNIVWAPFGALGSLWSWITGSSEDMSKYLPDEVNSAQNSHPEEL